MNGLKESSQRSFLEISQVLSNTKIYHAVSAQVVVGCCRKGAHHQAFMKLIPTLHKLVARTCCAKATN